MAPLAYIDGKTHAHHTPFCFSIFSRLTRVSHAEPRFDSRTHSRRKSCEQSEYHAARAEVLNLAVESSFICAGTIQE